MSDNIKIGLNYYFSDKEIKITESAGSNVSVSAPLYAHESCKIKLSCLDPIKSYRRDIRWDFGDGTIITARNAVHYYKKPGKYIISCTFFDSKCKPFDNPSTFTVFVKEVVPTMLTVEHEYNMSPTLCRNTRLFEIAAALSNSIITEPSISVRRTFEKDAVREDSYFDIKDEYQYHLKKYYTFLQEVAEYDFNNDAQWDKMLKPTNEYKMVYYPLYGEFTSDLTWKIYALKTTGHDKTFVKTFNPKSSTIIDYRGQLNNDLYLNTNIDFKSSISEIPSSASICGKIATANIWYKTDKFDTGKYQNLFFLFNEDELKFEDDLQTDSNYINIPPLGISIIPKEANFNELYPFLSFNGFANNPDKINNHIESYVKNSFYKNKMVPVISAYFIKNDNIETNQSSITYNLYKEIVLKDTLKLKVNSHDPNIINGTLQPSSDGENDEYYHSYDILPKVSNGKFTLEFESNGNTIKIYETDNLIDLDNITLPKEQLYEENIDGLISCYTPHPLFDEASKFKKLLSNILSKENMLNYIISKGLNFIDDNINYKTCYIDRLLAILESVGDQVVQYNSDLFKNINELRDITRILSISYSTLFGNTFDDIYDLRISSTDSGKNIADRLMPGDTFYFGDSSTDSRPIIAFKRNGIIYPFTSPIKKFVVVEDYSGNIKTCSFETIASDTLVEYDDQTPEWIERNASLIQSIKGAFTLSEYDDSWLWNLILPQDFNSYNDKESLIHRYYSFYLFNENKEKVRKFNFLDEKTIPLINGKQITYDDWNDINGFTYHCLVNIITNKLS